MTERDPLFEFTHLRFRTYRYGLITGQIVAMGQLGVSFALAVFLQNGRHLSAQRNGLWLLPMGVFVIAGAQLAGRLIRYIGATVVVRIGLLSYAIGIVVIFRAISVDITVWQLLPGFVFFGIGIGFAVAQLVNVVLAEIPAESAGSAAGANTTMRQVGSALGVAVIGALLTTQTTRHATSQLNRSALAASTKSEAIAGVHSLGANYSPRAGIESLRREHHPTRRRRRCPERNTHRVAVRTHGGVAGRSALVPDPEPEGRARRRNPCRHRSLTAGALDQSRGMSARIAANRVSSAARADACVMIQNRSSRIASSVIAAT